VTDPIEPPDLDAWKRRAETAEAERDTLEHVCELWRERDEIAHRGRMHAIDALHRLEAEAHELSERVLAAEAERDRLRRALQRIVDWTDLKPTNVRRGGVRDFVREVLSTSPATTSPRVKTLYTGPDVLIEDAPLATEEP